jgi:hypothetical protein
MRPSEPALIEDFIERIPLIGQLWADALYTWVGVANALYLREMSEEKLQLPNRPSVVNPIVDDSVQAQRAA